MAPPTASWKLLAAAREACMLRRRRQGLRIGDLSFGEREEEEEEDRGWCWKRKWEEENAVA